MTCVYQRGIHNINLELVFDSNPDFVFHDSPGLESGSREELDNLKAFIVERAQAVNPGDRIHLIWSVHSQFSYSTLIFSVSSLCLPVDGDRIFLEQEMALFSIDTSGGIS